MVNVSMLEGHAKGAPVARIVGPFIDRYVFM